MGTRKYKKNRLPQTIRFDSSVNKYRVIKTNELFGKNMGTREEVWKGIAYWTTGKIKKEGFLLDSRGKIISRVKHEQNYNPKLL